MGENSHPYPHQATMAISHYIKEIGRGARGAKALDRAQAADLFGQVLDGQVTDLEVGAFCVAMRIKGETVEEMCGFLDAVDERIARFPACADGRPLIVLPSYNGARKLPVLTPLLALLLAREGHGVLLHGMRTEARRVLASEVLEALDIQALTAPKQIAPGTVAHIATGALLPGLARLLAVREAIGLRTPAHSVVKLLAPCAGPALLVASYTHAEYFELLGVTFATRGMHALLSRGLEGEVAADPRRQPRYDAYIAGVHQLLQQQQPGTAAEVEDITTICGGLNINIGTLNSRTITSMLLAGKKANQLGHPVVLDPVGAGASRLRTDTAFRLLRDVKFTVIRGNISEIKTLASGAGTTKGVDADVADKVTEANLDSAVAFAKAFAAQTGAVIAITGAIDIVADAEKAYCIRNGNAMMSSITGTGCQLSALTAAFVTANPGHPLEAAAAAVCAMGLAGETAHKRLTPLDGNSTYRNYIIDAIYNMTPDQLEEGANYEVR